MRLPRDRVGWRQILGLTRRGFFVLATHLAPCDHHGTSSPDLGCHACELFRAAIDFWRYDQPREATAAAASAVRCVAAAAGEIDRKLRQIKKHLAETRAPATQPR